MTYKRILVPVENSPYDAAILEHVRRDYDRIADVGSVEIYRVRR